MRVLERAGQYNGHSRFEPWLFSIARNLAIDYLRRRQKASLATPDTLGPNTILKLPAPEVHSWPRQKVETPRESRLLWSRSMYVCPFSGRMPAFGPEGSSLRS